jgi:hypothetical protein
MNGPSVFNQTQPPPLPAPVATAPPDTETRQEPSANARTDRTLHLVAVAVFCVALEEMVGRWGWTNVAMLLNIGAMILALMAIPSRAKRREQ